MSQNKSNLNYFTVLKIFNTLPIGYYLGERLEACLEENSEESFINLVERKIYISFPMIKKNFEKINDDTKLETIIRTLLYHEVSHAILTPTVVIIDPIIFNIFEDERIETILKDYYLDVDFKWFLSLLTKNSSNSDPIIIFFNKVRLRECSEEENLLISNVIKKYSKLNKTSPYSEIEAYQNDILLLFKILTSYENLSKKEEERLYNLMSLPTAIGEQPSNSESILTHLNINLSIYNNPQFRKKLSSILYRHSKIKGNINSVMSKTSGKLNPKLLTKPDNYKWFESKGDGSHFNSGKIKFNLFIDQSGSFLKYFNKVNSILRELSYLETEVDNFEFELVTIDNEIIQKDKFHRFISTNEKRFYGNSLTPELFTIYKKLQNPNYKNVNIVLFEGSAVCDRIELANGQLLAANSKEQCQCFKAFNHTNTIIISDISNKQHLDRYCKSAKLIITKDYADKLEDILLKKIQIIL